MSINLEAENQRLLIYVNQLEREILTLKKEKTNLEISLHAHVERWQKQTGSKFMGFYECTALYVQNWVEDNKVVKLKNNKQIR